MIRSSSAVHLSSSVAHLSSIFTGNFRHHVSCSWWFYCITQYLETHNILCCPLLVAGNPLIDFVFRHIDTQLTANVSSQTFEFIFCDTFCCFFLFWTISQCQDVTCVSGHHPRKTNANFLIILPVALLWIVLCGDGPSSLAEHVSDQLLHNVSFNIAGKSTESSTGILIKSFLDAIMWHLLMGRILNFDILGLTPCIHSRAQPFTLVVEVMTDHVCNFFILKCFFSPLQSTKSLLQILFGHRSLISHWCLEFPMISHSSSIAHECIFDVQFQSLPHALYFKLHFLAIGWFYVNQSRCRPLLAVRP